MVLIVFYLNLSLHKLTNLDFSPNAHFLYYNEAFTITKKYLGKNINKRYKCVIFLYVINNFLIYKRKLEK